MSKPTRCTTHSHACDCREEYFKNLEEANKVLREEVEFYAERNSWRYSGDDRFDCNITYKDASKVITGKQINVVGGSRARQALEKADEIMGEKK